MGVTRFQTPTRPLCARTTAPYTLNREWRLTGCGGFCSPRPSRIWRSRPYIHRLISASRDASGRSPTAPALALAATGMTRRMHLNGAASPGWERLEHVGDRPFVICGSIQIRLYCPTDRRCVNARRKSPATPHSTTISPVIPSASCGIQYSLNVPASSNVYVYSTVSPTSMDTSMSSSSTVNV